MHVLCTYSSTIRRRNRAGVLRTRGLASPRVRTPSRNLDEIALASYSCEPSTPLLCAPSSRSGARIVSRIARYGRMSARKRARSRGETSFYSTQTSTRPRWCTSAVDKVRERHLIWFEKRVSETGARTRASLARGTVYVRYREAFTKSRKNVTMTEFAQHNGIVLLDRIRGACSDECITHASLTKSRDRCSRVHRNRHRCLRIR